MTSTPLPPFPKPDIWSHVVTVWRDGVECQIDQGPRFTSNQMREYASQARAEVEAENANLRLELQSARDINLAVVNRQQAEIEALRKKLAQARQDESYALRAADAVYEAQERAADSYRAGSSGY